VEQAETLQVGLHDIRLRQTNLESFALLLARRFGVKLDTFTMSAQCRLYLPF
jgi:hypothetical protein